MLEYLSKQQSSWPSSAYILPQSFSFCVQSTKLLAWRKRNGKYGGRSSMRLLPSWWWSWCSSLQQSITTRSHLRIIDLAYALVSYSSTHSSSSYRGAISSGHTGAPSWRSRWRSSLKSTKQVFSRIPTQIKLKSVIARQARSWSCVRSKATVTSGTTGLTQLMCTGITRRNINPSNIVDITHRREPRFR